MSETTFNEKHTTPKRTLSISHKTFSRLEKLGRWGESADELINRLINEKIGVEQNLQERSF